MNIIFISIGAIYAQNGNSIDSDLLKYFYQQGHSVTVICQRERHFRQPTAVEEDGGIKILRIKTGNITESNLLVKSISTLLIIFQYKRVIRRYLKGIKYDLILYVTPSIIIKDTIHFLKKRDHAATYLMLRDFSSQSMIDTETMNQNGVKGLITRYLKSKERELYRISDCIGCMSISDALDLLNQNPYLVNHRIEVCTIMNDMQPQITDENGRNSQNLLNNHYTILVIYNKIMQSYAIVKEYQD